MAAAPDLGAPWAGAERAAELLVRVAHAEARAAAAAPAPALPGRAPLLQDLQRSRQARLFAAALGGERAGDICVEGGEAVGELLRRAAEGAAKGGADEWPRAAAAVALAFVTGSADACAAEAAEDAAEIDADCPWEQEREAEEDPAGDQDADGALLSSPPRGSPQRRPPQLVLDPELRPSDWPFLEVVPGMPEGARWGGVHCGVLPAAAAGLPACLTAPEPQHPQAPTAPRLRPNLPPPPPRPAQPPQSPWTAGAAPRRRAASLVSGVSSSRRSQLGGGSRAGARSTAVTSAAGVCDVDARPTVRALAADAAPRHPAADAAGPPAAKKRRRALAP
eukprot:TRINITY_DN31445_c0_g1_i2.p3 TRINITY_DN31445_c0_g1~~TRINITY_DN31445_c0_g1_i2.p3  ORF type:complete len:335 (+),score=96.77 TRINITY_DN31445_c0_g1_i2:66-1070(+)